MHIAATTVGLYTRQNVVKCKLRNTLFIHIAYAKKILWKS